jgi:hypothetical protein
MNWWSKNGKTLVRVFLLLLFLAVVAVVSITLVGPGGGKICTLVGCAGGIEVELTGLPETKYQVSILFPSGEMKTLTCGPGATDTPEPFVRVCSPQGAFFALDPNVTPPQEITVTVTVNDKPISQTFHPKYERSQPNGRDCPPTCYSATLKMNLP